jgi:spore germination protein YaaH
MNNKLIISLVIIFSVLLLLLTGFVYFNQHKPVKYRDLDIQVKTITPVTLPKVTYSAWIANWDEDRAVASLTTQSRIGTIMPFWYQLDSNGKVIASAAKQKAAIQQTAITRHLNLIPTITNEFDPDRVSALLDDPELQIEVIDDLVFQAQVQGYQGWDIDWEELYPGDKPGFSDFVRMFSEKLHSKKLILSVTLQAKKGASTDAPSTQAQDWTELAKSADQLRIMIYDYHHSDSAPGPITPLDELQAVLAYAVNTIPKEKIFIALPTYGYDWVAQKGDDLQYADAVNLVEAKHLKTRRDDQTGELTAAYTQNREKHTIWYQDAESTRIKIDIIRSFGINNFSFWRLGGEDPGIWQL